MASFSFSEKDSVSKTRWRMMEEDTDVLFWPPCMGTHTHTHTHSHIHTHTHTHTHTLTHTHIHTHSLRHTRWGKQIK